MRPTNLTSILLVLVALLGAGVALLGRGGDPAFIARQRDLRPVTLVGLERLLLSTHDPRAGERGLPALSATCASPVSDVQAGSWACVVRYATPPPLKLLVTVGPGESIHGTASLAAGNVSLRACCLAAAG